LNRGPGSCVWILGDGVGFLVSVVSIYLARPKERTVRRIKPLLDNINVDRNTTD